MDMENFETASVIKNHCITMHHIKSIIKSCFADNGTVIENYFVCKASDSMLGFLGDYWKLKIQIVVDGNKRKLLSLFVKAISSSNEAKANIVKEMKLFEKELYFYTVIKKQIDVSDLKPWSASLITPLTDAMVFQDLNSMQYKTRNKFFRFDDLHTYQALSTLARFHASTIIFEERKSTTLLKKYRIIDEHIKFLDAGGYDISNQWFIQCMKGALEAIKKFSKYGKNVDVMDKIRQRWGEVWESALKLSDYTPNRCCVICHRDLWNNNILFHYKDDTGDKSAPDDCLLVDFQAVRYQEPAGDVMVVLYCNLDKNSRENKIPLFLDYYYKNLNEILMKYNIEINDILTKDTFINSAENQKQWGLIVSACLTPQMWLDDTVMSKMFCDSNNFNKILSQDKGNFIVKMMESNNEYKNTILSIFEEIVERYCLK